MTSNRSVPSMLTLMYLYLKETLMLYVNVLLNYDFYSADEVKSDEDSNDKSKCEINIYPCDSIHMSVN